MVQSSLSAPAPRVAAQAPEDLGLQRIGVLELVDQDMREARGQRAAHRFMVAQQLARGEDQIVEIEKRSRALVVAETIHHRLHKPDELGEDARGGRLRERGPCFATRRVVAFCGGVQAIAIGLGEARALGGFAPLALLLVGAKATRGRAEIGMRAREQQPDKIGRLLRRRDCLNGFGHFQEPRRDVRGLRFIDRRLCAARTRSRLPSAGRLAMSGSSASGASTISVRRRRRWARILWISPTVSPGILQAPFRRAVRPASPESSLPKPDFNDLGEGEVGLVAVHHAAPGSMSASTG